MRMKYSELAYTALSPIIVLGLSVIGLVIYSKSLFLEKTPITKQNKESLPGVYKKGVIFVMDGVRADAIHAVIPEKATLYHNNFSVLERIPKKDIFKAVSIADLPTGTAMRILSTFSGIPTTLLSAQRSFNKQSSNVDNFISQLQLHQKSFIFYGDETWTYLFPEITPNIGESYHPYGLIPFSEEERIIDSALLAYEKHDYLIIHMISPDSYGHVHGTNSKEVKKALQIMNNALSRLYDTMTDDSFIAVLSDHGVNNDGSHGGSSIQEKASSFIFIARDISERTTTASQERLIQRKYEGELSSLFISEPVNIISQNDILPTLCGLIGLGVPYNSSGIILPVIPEERKDIYAQEHERQKRTLFEFYGKKYLETYLNKLSKVPEKYRNEMMADHIHRIFHKSSKLGMIIGLLFMGLGLLFQVISIPGNVLCISFVASILAIFMVAHSVYSIIHEDIISLFMCIFLSWQSLWSVFVLVALPVVSFTAGEFPLHAMDRFWIIHWIKKIPSRYPVPLLEKGLLLSSLLCLGVRFISPKSAVRNLKEAGSVLFAVSQIFSLGIPHISRSILLFLAPEILPVLLYAPYPALAFIYIFCPIIKKCAVAEMGQLQKGCFLFFLIKIMFFVTGHNHALSSINWEAAFLFSRKSIPGVSAIFVGLDLLMPFIYTVYTVGKDCRKAVSVIVLLQGICAVLGCAVNFWFLGQSLMWFIFTGRTVFESFFFISFLAVQSLLTIWTVIRPKHPYIDQDKTIEVSRILRETWHDISTRDIHSKVKKGLSKL
ncbi:GPI ethanolamine phosphate transferase 3 subunit O [Nematocida ausubeli]|nr:GPI ethanolamine phosphate transferase 3 subunit O [Nematocida ausubeli]